MVVMKCMGLLNHYFMAAVHLFIFFQHLCATECFLTDDPTTSFNLTKESHMWESADHLTRRQANTRLHTTEEMDDIGPGNLHINEAGVTDEGMVVVDLRSDTITQPSVEMKKAMLEAPLGDDVFEEDPTVNALQEKVATLLGKEAALFVPSGTMSNLVAVLTHCQQRGSEVILGHLSHIHLHEQGGIAQFGGVHPRTVRNQPDGTFDLAELRGAVRTSDIHFPVTSLVCVENSHNMTGGKVVPMPWLDELGETCRQLGIPLHMDGARLLNAATALSLPPKRVVRDCTSVSLCLSKGLGAPVGSVLTGPANFIQSAKRTRKALGGGMRQAGMLAAAGIYALDHVFPRLTRDHQLLQILAQGVGECGSKVIWCDPRGAHTNILMVECDPTKVTPQRLCQRMAQVTMDEAASLKQHVKVIMLPVFADKARLVIHCDITQQNVESALRKMQYVIMELEAGL